MMTHEDFIQEWNYSCSGAEPQTPDVLAELLHLIMEMMTANCGSPVNVEFIDNKGRIRLLEEEDEA